MPTLPRVTILILNHNGRQHLENCLPSLEAQTYPKDLVEIEVIDNGSSDGSIDFVKERHPQVRCHPLDRNCGFAGPYNAAVRRARSDYVAFLNNDTRVDANWLAELVSAAAQHRAACVGSRILDWTGDRVDFVGGDVSFIGHSWQRDHGVPATQEYAEERLLFACAGSMLVAHEVFLDAGGFDEDFFAYFEDVDFGWRLSLLGHNIVLAPRATTYHRLHGTASRIAYAQRLRLYERNALAMIYKNYETDSLTHVLPAAIALSLLRGLAHTHIDPQIFRPGLVPPATVGCSSRVIAHLIALEDFCRQLPTLRHKRAVIQRRRRRSDRELFTLFGDPFRLHETGGRYEEVARTLIHDFAIDELFSGGVGRSQARPSTISGRAEEKEPLMVSRSNHERKGPEAGVALPTISVVVLTALGPTHLPDCLSSLRAQTYPAARCEVIVVDNASAKDPTPVVEQYYPGARVIRNATNVGFCVGNNIGARAATGEYVAFLNDDMRVHPDWIRRLVETARRRRAASVASRVVSWDGTLIDFVGASVNFEGKGFQVDVGAPDGGRHQDEQPLLFACGGAMLTERVTFLAAGGWDEAAFAYYEDVELGWRLWLLGHEVWFAPQAIAYHKHHGTWGRWPKPPRLRLYERNSLRMLYTHLERETLRRVLPAALLLATDRALLAADLARGAQETTAMNLLGPAVPTPPTSPARRPFLIEHGPVDVTLDQRLEPLPIGVAAILSGLNEFLASLPDLSRRRQSLQDARRPADQAILGRFATYWLSPCGAARQREHEEMHQIVVDALRVDIVAAAPAHPERTRKNVDAIGAFI